MTLPGVGRKTANVLRLAQRLGLGRRGDGVEAVLNDMVPDDEKARSCHLLQLHGRVRCHARLPECSARVIQTLGLHPPENQGGRGH